MIQRLLKEGLRSFISVFLWTLSQDCDDAFNGHQHRKSSKVFDICILKECMYIYNTILCIILHQITKNSYANARVFLMQRLWEGWSIWHRLLFWLPLSISLNFYFIESHENTIIEFYFSIWTKWECKTYICGTLLFTALQVNPTMTTSAAEKPGYVKNVHC